MTLHAVDTPAQAAARAALTQQLQSDQGAPVSTPQSSATMPAAAQTGDNAAQAQARAALDKTMADLNTPTNQTTASTAPVDPLTGDNASQAAARAAVIKKMTDLGTPMNQNGTVASQPIPMAAPAAPVSLSKEEKLQILLDHYKADQVSPEEYHKQRAAILAAP
jgi:hypothetical protein